MAVLRWAGMREASTAVFPVGCNPVGVLGSPGCEEGLAMVDGEVLGGGWRERGRVREPRCEKEPGQTPCHHRGEGEESQLSAGCASPRELTHSCVLSGLLCLLRGLAVPPEQVHCSV